MKKEQSIRHGYLEDVYALTVGSVMLALGLSILHSAGLVTGGIAGVTLLIRQFVALPTGVLFALLNLPFLVLALSAIGGLFALRTIIGSIGIALLSIVIEHAMTITVNNMAVAAIGAGVLLGMGTLTFVRHGAGVGGIGIVTVWLNRSRGWNVGWAQICIDLVIFAVAVFFLPPDRLFWSLCSAIVMGTIVSLWHRPDRYSGFSPVKYMADALDRK